MHPAASETIAKINLLRQQLVLAQVRIMELEDQSLALENRLTETQGLLIAAQQLGDAKLDETAHQARMLTATRLHVEQLERLHHSAANALAESQALVQTMQVQLAAAQQAATAANHEISVIKNSRFWRWTRWLRCQVRTASTDTP